MFYNYDHRLISSFKSTIPSSLLPLQPKGAGLDSNDEELLILILVLLLAPLDWLETEVELLGVGLVISIHESF